MLHLDSVSRAATRPNTSRAVHVANASHNSPGSQTAKADKDTVKKNGTIEAFAENCPRASLEGTEMRNASARGEETQREMCIVLRTPL